MIQMIPVVANKWETSEGAHLWVQSDNHIEHIDHAQECYDEYKDWFQDNLHTVETIWLGDMFEWNIPTHIPTAIKQQRLSTGHQWKIFKEKLNFEKPFVFTAGNHEFRIINTTWTNEDPFERECRLAGVHYSRVAMYWKLSIHNHSYLFYLSHGYGGGALPFSHFKTLWRDGLLKDCDFAIMGHSHHNRFEPHYSYQHDKLTDQMLLHKQYWIRAGSFLQNPEYVARFKLRAEELGNVIISFLPGKKPVISQTLSDWRERFG